MSTKTSTGATVPEPSGAGNPKCNFLIAWVGVCNSADCDHSKLRCHCGELATHDCPQTMGPMTCGAPLCDEHEHDDPAKLCPTVESVAYALTVRRDPKLIFVNPPSLTEAGAMEHVPPQVWVMHTRNGCEQCHGVTWIDVMSGEIRCGGHWSDDVQPCVWEPAQFADPDEITEAVAQVRDAMARGGS